MALLVTVAASGSAAVDRFPRPVRQPDQHRAAPPPEQRWGTAGGGGQLTGSGNRAVPVSMRQRYPLRAAEEPTQPMPNAATLAEPSPQAVTGFDPETSVELPARRDAFVRTYANADGTQTTTFADRPVNYRGPGGAWLPVEARLVPAAGGGWHSAAAAVDVRVAARADAPALVNIELDNRRAISFGLAGASGAAVRVRGNAATFPGARPHTDLEFEVGAGWVKETLVLRSAAAPPVFVFPLGLRGLRAEVDAAGRVLLRDELGDAQAAFPAGFMVDAAGVESTGVRYQLVAYGGRQALEVSLDRAWLRDPARRYPVRVDPSVDWAGADSSLVVRGGSSRSGGAELLVGNVGGAASASYLKFGGLVDRLRFHTVYGAQLSIVGYDAPSCSPRPVSVHAVTQAWSPGAGWAYPGPAVGGALASRSFAHGFIPAGRSSSPCPVDASLLDLGRAGRDVVQGWVNGGANNGLSLRASATDPLGWKRIAGPATANPPTLFVTHSPYNAAYAIPSPVPNPPVLQNQAGKVKVTVTNKSAEAWSPSAYYLAYRVYDANTHRLVTQRRAADLPGTVARNTRVTVEATIAALPPGRYFIDFTMVRTGGAVFTDHQVPPARIVLVVVDIPPVLQELYPPNGYQAQTLAPQLWARAVDIDAPPALTLRFAFEICELNAAGNRVNCTASGDLANQAWTVPAGKLFWSRTYQWRATVKDGSNVVTSDWVHLLTWVPQPAITGELAGAQHGNDDRDFDPKVGNYTGAAIDATVTTVGPPLRVVRTYNSLDPRRDLAFGAGWVSQFDMRITPDDDGSGNVVVTYQDGRQVRFGRNPDGTFAAPQERAATLQLSGTTYTLADRAGVSYQFTGTGRLARVTDAGHRSIVLTYDTATGRLSRAHVSNSQTNTNGRALRFTWTGTHVTAVADDTGGTWTYTYSGDLLTKVCGLAGDCTSYSYASGSHYRTAVLDSRPESYWRLGEAEGTAAGSEVAVNLGKDAGVYRSVTLGTSGVAGTTAATFNGTTSVLELPKGTVKKSRDTAVEVWFKMTATQTGGPLIGYQTSTLDSTSTAGLPVLYVGTDGRLRGQFRTGTVAPIASPGTVNNGAWHHAVLSTMGSTQTLWLDGVQMGTLTGTIDHSTLTVNQVGAAYATGTWPAWGSTARRFFSGSIDEVAIYNHPLGRDSVTAHYRYGSTAADQLTAVTLPSGRVAAEVAYDTVFDRVSEYTDTNGGTWKLGRPTVYGDDDDLRSSVQVIDPANRPYLYEYDALAGWILRTGTPLGIGIREEDLPGFPAPTPSPTPSPSPTCTTPDPGDPSFCTILPGDPGGAPPFVRQPLDGIAIRTFEYDENGNPTAVTDENGQKVTMAYNDRGNVTARTTCRAAGVCFTERHTYPATVTNPLDPRNDLVLETRDPRSSGPTDNTYRTSYTYTAAGELATQTNPDGGIVRHTYTSGTEPAVGGGATPPALVATTTDPRGAVTRYAYYANGDLARVTTPSGLVTTYTYDALGRKVSKVEVSDSFPAGLTTTYGYDKHSRPTSTVEPAVTDPVTGTRHQRVTAQAYDADGNLLRETVSDALGSDPARVTAYTYDNNGRVAEVTDAEGHATSYDYDRLGNKVGMVDANGNEYRYAYTARNAIAEVRLRDWNGDPAGAPPVGDHLVVDSYAYDMAGRLARHTDAMGRRYEYIYFADDQLATVTLKGFHNSDGSTRDYVVESNTYDAAGHLTRKATGNGAVVTQHTITRAGQIASTTVDPTGLNRRTTFTYDLAGNVTSTIQAGAAANVPWPVPVTTGTVAFEYDLAGKLTKETNGALVTTHRYDQRGLRVATVDPRGAAFTTTYRYDELGRQIEVVRPAVATEGGGVSVQAVQPATITGYDTFDSPVSMRDERGAVSRGSYDRMGRLTTATAPTYTAPLSVSAVTPTLQQRYDALGNLVESVDPRGNSTRYTFDRLNRVSSKEESGAGTWRYTYTRTGQTLSETDPTGAPVASTYDDLDRPITLTEGTVATRSTYDDAGNLLTQTAPSGARITMAYDATGALVRRTDPAGAVEQFGYDFLGRQVRQTDGLGRTRRTDYDATGRVTSESDLSPTGSPLRAVTYGYDAAGNRTSATDALGKRTTYAYDALNRLVSQVEPVSASRSITTTFGYDEAGNRTRYTDGRGNSTVYTYNSLGLLESMVLPATPAHPDLAARTFTVAYDAEGRPVRRTAPGGVVRQSSYDGAGRLTVESGTGAEAGTVERRLGYDAAGRITSVSSPGGTNTYTYDGRGAMVSAAGPSGAATFTYDADGQLASRTDLAGTTRYTYDRGRVATQTDAVTGVTQRIAYNAAGDVSTIDYGSGRVRGLGYDDLGRLVSDTLRNAAGGTVTAIGYAFDVEDRMVGKTTTGTAGAATHSYTYDDAGRLTSSTAGGTTTAYEWDDSGNRIRSGARMASYDARNRLLTDGEYTYGYSARGTLATRTRSGVTERFSFDALDRLVASGGHAYTYDGLNRVSSRDDVAFIYSGQDDELVSDGAQRFALDADGEPLAVAAGAQKRLLFTDAHDDVVVAIDPANTALSAVDGSWAYSPFGEVVAESGSVDVHLGFQGDYTDPDTGDVDMGTRWYDPGTGSFSTRDTATYDTGPSILANPYTYGAGDPLDFTDPDGEWPCFWCKLRKKIVKAGKSVGNFVPKTVSRVGKWVGGVVRKVVSAIGKIGRAAGKTWAKTLSKSVAKAAAKAAKAVTAAAKRAAKWAVKNSRIPAKKAAVKPIFAGIAKLIKAAAHVAAKVVASVRNVVRDAAKSAKAIFDAAVKATGWMVAAVSKAMQKASELVGDAIAAGVGVAKLGAAIGKKLNKLGGKKPKLSPELRDAIVAGLRAGAAEAARQQALSEIFDGDDDDCGDISWSGFGNCFQRAGHVGRFVANAPRTTVAAGVAWAGGGDCDWSPGLMVTCSNAPEWLAGSGNGGWTFGNTYLNSNSKACAANYLPHENTHATQWAILGWGMVPAYGADWAVHGGDRGDMFLERWAGAEAGGYGVPTFPECEASSGGSW